MASSSMMNKCMYSVKSKLKLSTLSLFEGWIVGVVAIKCIIDQVWGQDSGITDVIFLRFSTKKARRKTRLLCLALLARFMLA